MLYMLALIHEVSCIQHILLYMRMRQIKILSCISQLHTQGHLLRPHQGTEVTPVSNSAHL